MGATIAPAAALILRGGVKLFMGFPVDTKRSLHGAWGEVFMQATGRGFPRGTGRDLLSLKVVVGVQNWFFEKPFRTSYWSLIETVAVLLSFENTEFLCTRFRP